MCWVGGQGSLNWFNEEVLLETDLEYRPDTHRDDWIEVSILPTKGTNSEISKLTTFKKQIFQFCKNTSHSLAFPDSVIIISHCKRSEFSTHDSNLFFQLSLSTLHTNDGNSQTYLLKCQYGQGPTFGSKTYLIYFISTPLLLPRVYHTALYCDSSKYIIR